MIGPTASVAYPEAIEIPELKFHPPELSKRNIYLRDHEKLWSF
jgi:hypothetical protein